MADGSNIEWTDATWNPITGCAIVSPGCTNCYAMRLAGTRLKHIPSRQGLTKMTRAGPVWNGEVRFNEGWLDQPLRWKRPRRIFVCAHGDLFAEGVPDEWIDKVFAVMAIATHHTFQVLTKRGPRMQEYVTRLHDEPENETIRRIASAWPGRATIPAGGITIPLPNVWLGVSAERQQEANERIPLLLQTPAAVRFISAEPLLGPVDLTQIDDGEAHREVPREEWGPVDNDDSPPALWWNATTGRRTIMHGGAGGEWSRTDAALDWVIVGGESGPGARPMRPEWVRSLRDQCIAADVAFFFKQWGAWAPYDCGPLDVPETPRPMGKFQKKRAGRMLDGVEHSEMPQQQGRG